MKKDEKIFFCFHRVKGKDDFLAELLVLMQIYLSVNEVFTSESVTHCSPARGHRAAAEHWSDPLKWFDCSENQPVVCGGTPRSMEEVRDSLGSEENKVFNVFVIQWSLARGCRRRAEPLRG